MFALTELISRVVSGRGRLPEALRAGQTSYLRGLQRPDGGFPSRQGDSDAYYTAFGLAGLALLGGLDQPVAAAAADFLRHRLRQPMLPVEFIAAAASVMLLRTSVSDAAAIDDVSRMQRQAVEVFDPLRLPDGGYAKNARSRVSSTYHTFLVVSCKQLLGIAGDDLRAISGLLSSRQRPDGGFAEVQAASSSGVNPTAAAVLLACSIQAQAVVSGQALSLPALEPAARYLAAMQTPEGGLRASALVPAADLLSTFSGLVALVCLDAVGRIDTVAIGQYVAGLEHPSGGFRGNPWDAEPDCEYTFYALGTLALLDRAG